MHPIMFVCHPDGIGSRNSRAKILLMIPRLKEGPDHLLPLIERGCVSHGSSAFALAGSGFSTKRRYRYSYIFFQTCVRAKHSRSPPPLSTVYFLLPLRLILCY